MERIIGLTTNIESVNFLLDYPLTRPYAYPCTIPCLDSTTDEGRSGSSVVRPTLLFLPSAPGTVITRDNVGVSPCVSSESPL